MKILKKGNLFSLSPEERERMEKLLKVLDVLPEPSEPSEKPLTVNLADLLPDMPRR